MPVVSAAGALLGIVSELDLIARNAPLHEPHYIAVLSAMIPVSLEEHREYKEQLRQALAINAEQLMSSEVETIAPDADIAEALETMLNPEITMLPVMENGQLVGVVTRTDLVRLIETLEMGISGDE
ncbi:MAG: CBS domain-containing protein [Caldilineaceae bacterium]|nr:CBS domain-containing protein [Caldilineaceae bacterium]